MPKVWLESDMRPVKEKIRRLQKKLLESRLREEAARAGSHDPTAVARRCLDLFEDELSDWEDDIETISPLRIAEAVSSTRGVAPHLWATEQTGAGPSGKSKHSVTSKADFRSVDEEARFIQEHGRDAYLALPGQSRFAKVA